MIDCISNDLWAIFFSLSLFRTFLYICVLLKDFLHFCCLENVNLSEQWRSGLLVMYIPWCGTRFHGKPLTPSAYWMILWLHFKPKHNFLPVENRPGPGYQGKGFGSDPERRPDCSLLGSWGRSWPDRTWVLGSRGVFQAPGLHPEQQRLLWWTCSTPLLWCPFFHWSEHPDRPGLRARQKNREILYQQR